ncbi:MAG: hypothetical protein R3E96_07935 [Planctomycetota bacterium]
MKGFPRAASMAKIDLTGKPRSTMAKGFVRVGIHLVCYLERPDVQAIVHAHRRTRWR